MTTDNQTSVEIEERSVSPTTPGAILSKKRKEAELTIEEVASRLCLRATVIEAIELDDFSGISRHVFSRGYLRAYARLLQLNPDKIIDSFNALNLKEDSRDRMLWQAPRTATTTTSKESPVKWLFILVVTCSCFLAVIWWNANGTKNKMPEGHQTSLLQPIKPSGVTKDIEQDSLGSYSQSEGIKS